MLGSLASSSNGTAHAKRIERGVQRRGTARQQIRIAAPVSTLTDTHTISQKLQENRAKLTGKTVANVDDAAFLHFAQQHADDAFVGVFRDT